MDIIEVAVIGLLNIACFYLGAKVGQKVVKGETIEIPSINPIELIREHNEKKEAEMQQNKLETIMRNIEAYDGTSRGQEDVR